MNDYKEIRQRYLAGESQRSIAKSIGISRNTVKKYCKGDTVPWERKTPERQATVVTDDVLAFIASCLSEDEKEGLRKQQHTARRIFDRLVAEKDFTGGESTIRRIVSELKNKRPKAFIPLQFDPGEAMQVDWGEATIYLKGEKLIINLFCARLCYSCRPVVLAYRRQNEESFLDAFVKTFEILGGITSRVIFDNGKVAVKEGFGAHARMQEGYSALSAHYGFEAVFCNPAEGHEKGLVEGLVGWARRNICVPVPHVESIDELNTLLLHRCLNYEKHQVRGRKNSVGILFHEEALYFSPLPRYIFETAKCTSVRVSALSTVRFRTNTYSVPVKYVGYEVSVKGYPETIEVHYKGSLISVHERQMGKNQTSYHLEDYMPLLETRPRAVFDAAPVKQNVPPEVLAELKENTKSQDNVISILQLYAEKQTIKNRIEDPVIVSPVDLHKYDELRIGKEVKIVE
ncbi:transposase [Lachnospiraceae bacterium PF1-21]|uniref:IS21 family transposase n=1 Tax=Ohessyouella blattaphilus TaxID=2949333 RepID=UPI003E2563F8